MEEENLDLLSVAPCGVVCILCAFYYKEKNRCFGCNKEDKEKSKHCTTCLKKKCVKEKGYTYCFECNNFPCKKIKYLDKKYKDRYNISLIENGFYMKKFGVNNFLKMMTEKYKCSECGKTVTVHYGKCISCGKNHL